MKILLILLLLTSSIFAREVSMRYDVHVTMFGHVGYADFTLSENGDEYEANLLAKTIDIAAALLKKRVETFTSRGKIINGIYIPYIFIKTKNTTRENRVQTYYFDHESKEVRLVEEKTKIVNKTGFDTKSFQIVTREVEEKSKKEETLETFIGNDTLSAYLNSKYGCSDEEKNHTLLAIGANNDKNNISYRCLSGQNKEAALSNFSGGVQDIYNLHVEPLDKNDKIVDVLIAYDSDGFLKEGLLDEIFWIGKMMAIRVSHEISN
ncbi:DUF3108 domain-containing protein [Sulfurimonas sp.]|uniref:DUF3108 domain-containing protein n=1 Tax=Sulfurimonas sp. TaxID=2022749 RepID=UPI0026009755|nr:DUF3108 domain-containing protein [Sulfurimonas sp.]MBW6487744.1 DUF3108 domain-containing protein [Sulfurimonas sp.]